MGRGLVDVELFQRLQLEELGFGRPVAPGDALGVVVLHEVPDLQMGGEAAGGFGEGRADDGEKQAVAGVRTRLIDRPADAFQAA